MSNVRTTKEFTDSGCGGGISVRSGRMVGVARNPLPWTSMGTTGDSGGTHRSRCGGLPNLEALQRHALLREGVL